ncbi:SDR family oxidoreductase [Rhodanobacter sp. DHB23]|uniref:SDR family oxidoreductase n=1 Tax=Rhodanobacter sp. DHB23 TaxID=2775923 RepID=UPI001786D440|nr:SDR family oxidoreductase [Rhodanobacter sp. DHB23]MBD8872909.1 SDR family oxidoreductase [Rhodanobacter sp. DHB23]
MQLHLDGRHALVCGASQGIGRASAIELALLGANVTLLARRAEMLEALAAELPRTHTDQRHGFIAVDVGDTAALRTQAEALVARAPVHILVNNSGGPPPGSVLDATPQDFLAAWQQHLLACHTLAQAVVPGMRAAGWGRIVNVISTSVREPIPGIGVSNTTRGAVASWAKTLAGELAPFGITVNNVLPGSTRTPRIEQIVAARAQKSGKPPAEVQQAMEAEVPMRRFADAAEIAAAVAFLASPAASYITGVSLPVDGGRMRSL